MNAELQILYVYMCLHVELWMFCLGTASTILTQSVLKQPISCRMISDIPTYVQTDIECLILFLASVILLLQCTSFLA